jgi:hypothetical protein
MIKTRFIFLLLAVVVQSNSWAQNKFEKESRITRDAVHPQALQFIDSLQLTSRVRWYLEEGLTEKTIEAKFKKNKLRYSVEFDTLGRIQDVEVDVSWNDLALDLRSIIESSLEKNCSRHRIIKVQRQFSGKRNLLFLLINNAQISEELEVKYEVIVRCRQENSVDLYEYLFSQTGFVLSVSRIIFKNSSHLEY